jgi:hypothetical protein
MALTFFQQQVENVLFILRQPSMSFDTGATEALKQIEAKTCNVSTMAQCLFQPLGSICPKTCYQRPEIRNIPPFKTFQVSMGGPAQVSMLRQLKI